MHPHGKDESPQPRQPICSRAEMPVHRHMCSSLHRHTLSEWYCSIKRWRWSGVGKCRPPCRSVRSHGSGFFNTHAQLNAHIITLKTRDAANHIVTNQAEKRCLHQAQRRGGEGGSIHSLANHIFAFERERDTGGGSGSDRGTQSSMSGVGE